MKSFTIATALGAVIAPVLAASKGNLTPIQVKGNAFYKGDERFYVRGVAYQPGGAADAQDPLLDTESLKRDIANFKDLGINTVRIYTIDNSKNHDEGMKMLDDAGIYLALDANSPKYSLNRESKDTLQRSYNDVYLQSVFATIDAFADYNNLLALFSGNEVINDKNNSNAAPFIKAVTRDMKQYISNRATRQIPVGYSAADVAEIIEQQALYFDCGTDDERADFFAFNDYSWCDFEDKLQTFEGAGWNKKMETYKNFPKPIFLSEHGCIEPNRQWGEVSAIYSSKMSSVYSGGLAYEYTVEPNNYGIVDLKDGKITPNKDFKSLKAAYAKASNPTGNGGAKTSGTASKCPPKDKYWDVTETLLPAIPTSAVKYMNSGAGTGPGLSGDGSHFAGKASEGTATAGSGQATRTPNGSAAPSTSGGADSAAPVAVEIPLRFVGMVGASVLLGAALMF
ncbi:hypothetical protein P280DRAFT_416356 [Massarina eburnea CBS 473.64]|uniref:1,3-beta-glucanosyltransferase n=1 Tax=Massarina eburnea CBS 473.64 TaxID=1395130 RepID=A0A6A6SJH5_9PLEO|nr:hypothetical protein P280DRAFT_416356 [Massarina eburnea CBS 473.64]